MTAVPTPAIDAELVFADAPATTYRITHIHGSDAHADGWGCTIQAEPLGAGVPRATTVYEGEYGTEWEYVR